MLRLAQVEQRRGLDERVPIALAPLVDELIEAQAARIAARRLRVENSLSPGAVVTGERFLVRQAFGNLLDNAIDFTPDAGAISVSAVASSRDLLVRIFNQGQPIPDYALPRVTERFYSLPRPATGRKSTGLGLSFVLEVAELHSGAFEIRNEAGGVAAELRLPLG